MVTENKLQKYIIRLLKLDMKGQNNLKVAMVNIFEHFEHF